MITLDKALGAFRAAGEETRLRILTLLALGELSVSELTQILAQSQPRVSRHLKVLSDSGLVDRYREGAWVFYRLAEHDEEADSIAAVRRMFEELAKSEDRVIARDLERLRQVRREREEAAAAYFARHADQWEEIRTLHLPGKDIDAAARELLGPTHFESLIDLGAGAGQMLIALAESYERAIGYDLSPHMVAVARAALTAKNIVHAQVRLGDLFAVPAGADVADVVTIHLVLHYLADPAGAVNEAARLLKPGGRLLIVDFAPHELEFLRDAHAHRRLGFSDGEVRAWTKAAGLEPVRTETLAPSEADAARTKLTVKLWLAAKPAEATAEPHAQKEAIT